MSIDRAHRDPARRGPGESAVSSGDVRPIERDTLLARVFADIGLFHGWFGNLNARGKPSPESRGRLVETEPAPTRKALFDG